MDQFMQSGEMTYDTLSEFELAIEYFMSGKITNIPVIDDVHKKLVNKDEKVSIIINAIEENPLLLSQLRDKSCKFYFCKYYLVFFSTKIWC